MRYDTQKRKQQIMTNMICPLCGEPVEIAVNKATYHGYCESEVDVPEGAHLSGIRRFGNGKERVYFSFPGYVPHCSNNECFLRSANRVFRTIEIAEEAWIEGVGVER